MKINWVLASSTAVLLWILIFVTVSIIMFMPRIGGFYRYILLVIEPLVIFFCAYLYFRRNKGAWQQGLFLGVYYIIISTILDLIITIPLFVKSYEFFKNWNLYIGFLEVIIVCIVASYVFKSKQEEKIQDY